MNIHIKINHYKQVSSFNQAIPCPLIQNTKTPNQPVCYSPNKQLPVQEPPSTHLNSENLSALKELNETKNWIDFLTSIGISVKDYSETKKIEELYIFLNLSEPIESGGIGTIHTSKNEQDKDIVFKVFDFNKRKFLIEAGILKGIPLVGIFCQNLIQNAPHVYSVIKAKDGFIIKMDQIDGLTILEHLRTPHLSIKEKIDIAAKLASILKEIITLDISHNDISMRNLMIGENGQLFLVDFDSAQQKAFNSKSTFKNDLDFLGILFYKLFSLEIEFFETFYTPRDASYEKKIKKCQEKCIEKIKKEAQHSSEKIKIEKIKILLQLIHETLESNDKHFILLKLDEIQHQSKDILGLHH